MRYKWEKYNWWIYCLIIAIALFAILYRVYPNTDQDNARYILSAISQGLAAILALVVTVTFIVAQMMGSCAATKKIILNSGTKFLMLFFGIGIILPLLALKFGWFCVGVNLSIVIASFCIASLLPFLKNVSDVLMYDVGYVNLYGEITDAIELRKEVKAVQGIIDLESICKDSIKESRKEVTSKIIQFLSEIGKKSARAGKRFEYATSLVVRGLREIGIGSIEKGFDDIFPETAEIAVRGLKDIGVEAAKNRSEELSGVVLGAIDGLKDIGTKAAENRFVRTTINAVKGLKDVFMALRDSTELKDKYNKYNAVNGLWCLGAFVTEYIPDLVDFVIENLKEMEGVIGRDLLMEYEKGCIMDHPNLKSALEEFKRRYTER